MSNILKAIHGVIYNPRSKVGIGSRGRNRANSVGEALEEYIKDCFAGTFGDDERNKIVAYNKIFSYIGNQNNPPDLILKGGDAIEVKKLESANASLALNSSYPKDKIYCDSEMITASCRQSEDWTVKDIIYVIGNVVEGELLKLWFVYGDCFAADKAIYKKIKATISEGIKSLGIELATTNEFAKVKKVDPLGITDLRVRGMWHVANPQVVFKYLLNARTDALFQMNCLMKTEKFNSFPEKDRDMIINLHGKDNFSIKDVEFKDPNNPAKLIDGKLITYRTYKS